MSTENLSKDIIGDLIEPPLLIFSSGSNHELTMSPSSSQSSLTKHLDVTNNYNSESFQQFNNSDNPSKIKTTFKSNDNVNHNCHSSFKSGEITSINKNTSSHNISTDVMSSEEDVNNEYEMNKNLDEINCDDSIKQIKDEQRSWRTSGSNSKINKTNYENDEKEIVYDQINEIIAKITTGKIFQ
jgi:hypothetical protein